MSTLRNVRKSVYLRLAQGSSRLASDADMGPLLPGDEVVVRCATEILATLDANGSLGGLPFMPEMLGYCGKRFKVQKRAERICDTINWSGSLRLVDTVTLGDLRCDGAGHDGCQADCGIFWKEAWLRRIAPGDGEVPGDATGNEPLALLLAGNCKVQETQEPNQGSSTYRCQATELVRASQPADSFPYVLALASGNVSVGHYARIVVRAAINETARKCGLVDRVALRGPGPSPLPGPPLNLQPGDWVKIKSAKEIHATLNPEGSNRGLWFDREMLAYCGKVFRVRRRIHRFIHDANGKMVELKSDAVSLDGTSCSGEQSMGRWFCPRALFPYWRDAWLTRVAAPEEFGR